MRRFLLLFLGIGLSFCALTTAAQAQATRTWVSGVGDDANPCSRTAPCKTFAGAINKTADCGEIDVLDPGGFGPVTLTKGIKIDGGGGEGGMVASILQNAANQNGVNVNNSSANCAWDVLRNLDINGANVGLNGINFIAGGTVALENVDVENFAGSCVNISQAAPMGFNAYNANFEHCTTTGVLVNYTGGGTERVTLSNVKISKSNGFGLSVTGIARVAVRDCDINQNGGGGVLASGANANVQIFNCQIVHNQNFGIRTMLAGTVSLALNTISYNNGPAMQADAGSNITTFSNNWVIGNSPDGTRTGTTTPQ